MVVVADDAGVTGSFVGGVEEEEAVRDLFFLRSTSGLSVYFFGKTKSVIHYPILIHNRRKQAELACINYGYHSCI